MRHLKLVSILFAGAMFACAAPSPGSGQSSGEIIPRTMRLVTVAEQTVVYARPTLAARELARLPAGRRLVFLAKGGEERLIGAVYSGWFKVRGESGSGWVFAGDLANADPNRPPYSYKQLMGVWNYGGDSTASYPSRIELKRDARFDFAGWRIKDFQSHGAWIYNNLDNTLTLRFFDKRDHWNDWMSSADRRLYNAAAGYGRKRPMVHMRVEREGDASRPRMKIDLLGTRFLRESR